VLTVKLAEPGVTCGKDKWKVRCTMHGFCLRTDR